MRISQESLQGFMLEEALAYLIRNSGYRLLVNKIQDPIELGSRGNGLVVIGRGADHQVDVLGELSWVPAFTYPLRLFVEAKYRKGKTGIDVIRSLVGTLTDINQNNQTRSNRSVRSAPPPPPKYFYVGSVFSTSGFSIPAESMALAHGISLIELGGSDFAPLLDKIKAVARAILPDFPTRPFPSRLDERGSNEIEGEIDSVQRETLQILRTKLRMLLTTQTYEPQFVVNVSPQIEAQLGSLTETVERIGNLFVGMVKGPFMLVLKADDPEAFINYARRHPNHPVNINWTMALNQGKTWIVTPKVLTPDNGTYRLTFQLPESISSWIFTSGSAQEAALDMKRQYFKNISVFYTEGENDLLIRMKFDPNSVRIDRD